MAHENAIRTVDRVRSAATAIRQACEEAKLAQAEYVAMGGIGSSGELDAYLAVAAEDGSAPSLPFTSAEFASAAAYMGNVTGEWDASAGALFKITR